MSASRLATFAFVLAGVVATLPTLARAQCILYEFSKSSPSDGSSGDGFGTCVDSDANVFAIGAPQHDGPGDSGRVYVFGLVGGVPSEVTILKAADAATTDSFGQAVSVSNTTIAIGAPNDDVVNGDAGSVYVFDKLGGAWWQTAKLTTMSNLPAGAQLGSSVALDGNRLATIATGISRLYVFERTGSTWNQTTNISTPVSQPTRVALRGDRIVVGSPGNSRIDILELQNGVWTPVHFLTTTGNLGVSLDLGKDMIVAGRGSAESAIVYEGSGVSWTGTTLVPSDPHPSAGFGTSVGCAGTRIIVGAPLSNNFGNAYVFERHSGTWIQSLEYAPSDTSASFGSCVALAGDTALVGAYYTGSGHAFWYSSKPIISEYGQGCDGSGGFTPRLSATGCARSGGFLNLSIDSALGGSNSLVLFGLQEVPAPSETCPLLIAPVLPPMFVLPLFGAGSGAGSITVSGSLPSAFSDYTFTVQAFVADPARTKGYATTNGLRVDVQ